MFNGVIFKTGVVKIIKKYKKSILVGIKTRSKFSSKDLGSSISCNGVCLTLTKIKAGLIFFYISNETIKRSNFNFIDLGHLVNLEKSLTYGQKISGHFIQGHVDTTAVVKRINVIDKTWELKLQVRNKKFIKYLEEKASISINGVSLTISKISNNNVYLNIIPHTLRLTNLKNLKTGNLVNVELDIFGKYIYKYNS